jgi:hypothetical protein
MCNPEGAEHERGSWGCAYEGIDSPTDDQTEED